MSYSFSKNTIILLSLLPTVFYCPVFGQSQIALEKGDLKAVFIDNSSYGLHRKGYNGISELYHKNQDSTLFVPSFAGVNLEHIFDGDSLVSLFEPRREPMTIKKISDTKVRLHQLETSISKVENWTIFEMVGPHYIDVEFRFVVRNPNFFDRGYVGLFWASYINFPEKIGINFKAKNKSSEEQGNWFYAVSNKHGKNGTHVGDNDNFDAYTAPNFNVDLNLEISDAVFTEPYYYGRFHNMVFSYLFAEPEEGVIRFTKSPSGAGIGKPAWDFQYILPDFEVGKEYSIKWRVLYKKWKDEKDIEKEYSRWIKTLR